jgi:hypothetical protein
MVILVLYFLLHSLTLAERTPPESASLARNLLKTSKLCNLATIMSQTGPNPDLDGNLDYFETRISIFFS